MQTRLAIASIATLALAACGPAPRHDDDDDDDDGGADAAVSCTPTGAEGSPETCGDNLDNDCDGPIDCHDPDCSGVGDCPVCGEVQTDEGQGIVLPDGIVGSSCSTDMQCGGGTPECVESECHASYVSTLHVIGFGANQVFDNVGIIESVCAEMEHSWLRDMEIRLIAPGGQVVRLQKFLGRVGGEVYLGRANDCDEGAPVHGTGDMYCWKPMAARPSMVEFANMGVGMNNVPNCFGLTSRKLPGGDYSAADPWDQFIGSPMNGEWKFVVTDLWPEDNGFLFNWTIQFNADAVEDCSGPIVE